MGMQTVNSAKGPVSEPNIVPLIDVLLVLIIIFMVITPTAPSGLPAEVPQAAGPQDTLPDDSTVVVQVMAGGKISINQEAADWATLEARLFDIFKKRADKVAFVKGDEEVPFAEVARAIDILRAAGVAHIGLMGEKEAKRRF